MACLQTLDSKAPDPHVTGFGDRIFKDGIRLNEVIGWYADDTILMAESERS